MKNKATDYYPIAGILIITVLGLINMGFIISTGIFSVSSYNEFIVIFEKTGFFIIVGGFCIFCAVLCWINFVLDVILKPKEEILFLYEEEVKDSDETEEKTMKFLDRKGRKFYFDTNSKFKVGKYYSVLKTHNYICEIIGESLDSFPRITEKKSYWKNFYFKNIVIEDLLILPIIYVIALPPILSFIASRGIDRLIGLVLSIFPVYVIFYDFIYKIKNDKL